MICVSAGKTKFTDLTELLRTEELIEIRIDMNDFSDQEMKKIFSSPAKTIATCRPGKFSEPERIRKLEIGIESGADFVDLELESKKNSFVQIVRTAKKHNCSIIISHHNFHGTPPVPELKKIFREAADLGADIVKIASRINTPSDNVRLLSLYHLIEDHPAPSLITIGMGEMGKITRVAAPFLGSPFTYASAGKGKETAAGQIEDQDLKKILRILENEP